MRSIVSSALVLFTLLGCIELNAQAVRGGSKADEKKPDTCAGATAPKLSLADVVLVLNTPNLKRCIVDYVKKRDVTFYAEPTIIDVLKVLGAPADLYPLIPPPPPLKLPPPPPPIAGSLTVICEPPSQPVQADHSGPPSCNIGVTDHYSDLAQDGKRVAKEEHYFGVAADGKKVVPGLPVGAAELQVYADGYDTEKRQVQLQENQPKEEHFRLKPNAAASRLAARELLEKVVAAFGQVEGLAEMAQVPSSGGSVALPDENGQLSKWEMSFSGRWGSMNMTFRSPLGECGASLKGEAATSDCRGKLKKSAWEGRFGDAVTLFSECQLPIMLARMLTREVFESDDSNVRKLSTKSATQAESDSYILFLDNSGLPSEIQYRSKPDANPLKVGYSNYLMKGGLRYPGQIDVKDANGKQLAVFTINDVPTQAPLQPRK